MSGFDNNEDMGEALKDISNGTADGGDHPQGPQGPPRNEEAAKLARERGWCEPQQYNYGDSVAAPAAVAVEGEGYVTIADGNWAHNAAKYEWEESFGDVGPENKSLEQQLFRADTINRQGHKFDEYAIPSSFLILPTDITRLMKIEVTAEAVERPGPINDVSNLSSLSFALLIREVPTSRAAPSHGEQHRTLRLCPSDSHSSVHHPCCSPESRCHCYGSDRHAQLPFHIHDPG
jgi:hypothetical protein